MDLTELPFWPLNLAALVFWAIAILIGLGRGLG